MSWARLDDRWHDHPKVIAAGLEAAGLWAMCLTWAYQARRTSPTPGVIPDAVLVRFAGAKAKRLAKTLHKVGMFDDLTDDGWPIHDFDEYLPKYDAEQAREAGARGGKARAAAGKPKRSAKRTASEPLSEPLEESQAVSVADSKQTSSTRASARRNPVPVPLPEPNGSGSDEPTAQTLVAEWIDLCGERPPGQVVGIAAKQVSGLLGEGRPAEQVRAGLRLLAEKRLHPSTLPSLVFEASKAQKPASVPHYWRDSEDDA